MTICLNKGEHAIAERRTQRCAHQSIIMADIRLEATVRSTTGSTWKIKSPKQIVMAEGGGRASAQDHKRTRYKKTLANRSLDASVDGNAKLSATTFDSRAPPGPTGSMLQQVTCVDYPLHWKSKPSTQGCRGGDLVQQKVQTFGSI